MGQGKLKFIDTHGKEAVVVCSDVGDTLEMDTIRQTINTYSNAVPYSQSYAETINVGGASNGQLDSVEIKAVMIFRDLNETNPGKALKQVSIPAPTADTFDPVKDAGYRVTSSKGTQVAQLINDNCGLNWEFVHGYMEGHRLFKKV